MKLVSLRLTNYGSFKEPTEFKFPEQPGLYFMRGDNRVDTRLGGNGAGKSTLWNALYWLTYGKTPDGRKAGDIANWDAGKGSKVELHYRYTEDNDVFVERTWGPISWTMTLCEEQMHGTTEDLTKADTNTYLSDIGATALVFQQSVLMAQGEQMFLDMKAEAQASLFGGVLGLDKWLDYSNKAAKMARGADDVCRRLEADLAKLEGRLEEARDYGPEIATFESKRKARRDALNAEFDTVNATLGKETSRLKAARADLATHDTSLANWIKERDDLRQRRDTLRTSLDDVKTEATRLERSIQELLDILDSKEPCPTCGSSLSDNHQHAKRMADKADGYEKEVKDLTRMKKDLQAKVGEVDALLAKAEEAVAVRQDELDKLDREERGCLNEIDRCNRSLDSIEQDLDRLAAETNPFKAMQEEATQRAKTHRAAFLQARTALDRANEKYSLYSLWIRGFKEVRLQLIAEALSELELEVNSSLAELGLDGWELRFDVDRETKGGSTQRGFAVTVLGPSNPKPVPWASWSGGEQQRLRLAANMGLANLIRTRMGITFPLEVWDEPTKGLSPQGVQDLLACLERRAQVEQRQIWIIDHTSHHFGGFAGTATIIKEATGSRIEQNWV